MTENKVIVEFIQKIRESIENKTFVKLTLSKQAVKMQELQNIYVRLIKLKDSPTLSFTNRYARKDEVKNYPVEDGILLITNAIENLFLIGELFTTTENIQIQFNKKHEAKIFSRKATITEVLPENHDKQKTRMIETKNNLYLRYLEITDQNEKVIPSMYDKFRQINKYIEIIESLVNSTQLPEKIEVVDMGAGKGYLTFAMYDYLNNQLGLKVSIKAVENQESIVKTGNSNAQKAGFTNLEFVKSNINDYKIDNLNILVALHACDTATDDAIYKGIQANAQIIVVAPCCHKQIRKQINCKTELQQILKHGILEERQAELITDGIRALLLEANGYKTKVFEFISSEHTAKNLMITAIKHAEPCKNKEEIIQQIQEIKKQFGIKFHYLEKLLVNC